MAAVQRGIAAGHITKPGAAMTKAAAEQDDCGIVGAQAVDAAAGAVVDAEQARLDARQGVPVAEAGQPALASIARDDFNHRRIVNGSGRGVKAGLDGEAFLFRWFGCGAVAAAKIGFHCSV